MYCLPVLDVRFCCVHKRVFWSVAVGYLILSPECCALMVQVGQLEAAASEHSKQVESIREELSDALAELDEEKER